MFRKILLSTLLAAALPLALPTSLLADTPTIATASQEEHHHPLERLRTALEHLHLTAAQKTSTRQILEAARAQIKPILEADKGNREKLREDVRPILKATIEKVAAVLTPEQKHHLRELLHIERGEHA